MSEFYYSGVKPILGRRYKHIKRGTLYIVMAIAARATSNNEGLDIVYYPIYGNGRAIGELGRTRLYTLDIVEFMNGNFELVP